MTERALAQVLAQIKDSIDWLDHKPTDDDLAEHLNYLMKLAALIEEWSYLRWRDGGRTDEQEARMQDLEENLGRLVGALLPPGWRPPAR